MAPNPINEKTRNCLWVLKPVTALRLTGAGSGSNLSSEAAKTAPTNKKVATPLLIENCIEIGVSSKYHAGRQFVATVRTRFSFSAVQLLHKTLPDSVNEINVGRIVS